MPNPWYPHKIKYGTQADPDTTIIQDKTKTKSGPQLATYYKFKATPSKKEILLTDVRATPVTIQISASGTTRTIYEQVIEIQKYANYGNLYFTISYYNNIILPVVMSRS